MEYFTLNNGVKMPAVGLGVYLMNDLSECEKAVCDALEIGYRHIDTAEAYGNESAVGNAIKASNLKRADLFVTTKAFINSMGYENTLKSFDESLKRLQLDYVDLYLVHQPYGDYYGSIRAMQKLMDEKRVRAVGVSNFFSDRLVDVCLNSGFTPAVNQVEMHPFYQKQTELSVMKKYGVQCEAYSPLARGRNNLFSNELLTKIANNHNKTVAQVVLRWLLDRKVVVIPKSVNYDRLKENLNVFDFSLTSDERELINSLDENATCFNDHRNHGFAERIILGSKK